MNGFRLRPKSATACVPEELTRFYVYPFVFAASAKRENKRDQLLKWELTCTDEILG